MKPSVPPIHDVPSLPTPVAIAGDVHLAREYPGVRSRFCAFVASRAATGGTLILLGDLFDYWIGRPQAEEPFLAPVFEALREAQRAGLHLVFQAGNRDFNFDGADGLELDLWPDVVRTTIDGRQVLFTHGDLLCTSDRGYHALRRILRKPGGAPRWWSRALPYGFLRYIAEGLRRVSARETKRKPRDYMGIDYGAARRWMDAAQVDVLVAGHVHTGVHHVLAATDASGSSREILVLKDWERGGGVVLFDEQGARLVSPQAQGPVGAATGD